MVKNSKSKYRGKDDITGSLTCCPLTYWRNEFIDIPVDK